jgi:hypothetical protein
MDTLTTRSKVRHATAPISSARLGEAVERARSALLGAQRDDGHWCYEFEADCTIPAEYVLMMHFLDEIDAELQADLAVYLRAHQAEHGGWPLYYGGALDVSCTVKAYWALKLAGSPATIRTCRTWRARARRSSPPAARRAATCSRGSHSRCSATCHGVRCRSCRSS